MSKGNFNKVEITLRHGCSPVNLLHIFRTTFPKNTSGGLLLHILFVKPTMKLDKWYKSYEIWYSSDMMWVKKSCYFDVTQTYGFTSRKTARFDIQTYIQM